MVNAEDVLNTAKDLEQKKDTLPGDKEIELTDDLIEKAIEKRFGVKSDQLVKKGTEVKVLTAEEEQAQKKEKQEAAFKTAIDKGWYTKETYDNYLLDSQKSEVERARLKFIADNPDIEDAGEVFDETFKVNEEDEFEDGENKIPNKAKIAAGKLVKKIADDDLESKYKDVIGTLYRYEQIQQEEAVRTKNAAIVTSVLAEMPPKVETEIEGVKYSIAVLPEDLKAATEFANAESVLTDKELTPEDLKTTVATYLLTKNMNRLLGEVRRVAYEEGRSSTERGAKGLKENHNDENGTPLSDAEVLVKQMKEGVQ